MGDDAALCDVRTWIIDASGLGVWRTLESGGAPVGVSGIAFHGLSVAPDSNPPEVTDTKGQSRLRWAPDERPVDPGAQ